MKKPLAYLKHLVKDPLNTMEDAKARKKEIMPFFLSFLGVFVVFVVLQVIINLEFLAIFTGIGLLGVVFFGFLLFVVKIAMQRFEALTCDSCKTLADFKTSEEFAKYVSYSVEKDVAIFKGQGAKVSPTNGVYSLVKITATSYAALSVDITCPNCGKVKRLYYSAVPFQCSAEEKKVSVADYQAVLNRLTNAVQSAVDDYNNGKKTEIPYTFHSTKNPNFENRYSFKGANASDAHPRYNGARIDYHKDIEEVFEHYIVLKEAGCSGKFFNPDKKSK